MASMGDMPDVIRNKMSLCSCHKLQQNALFALKKGNIAPFSRESLIVLRRFNKAVVQPVISLGVREKLWSQPYGRQTMAGRKNLAVI